MLSPIVASCLHSGNTKSHERRVNSTSSSRRIRQPFTPLPRLYLSTIPRRLQPAFREIWEYGNCRACIMPYRLLASRLKVHIRTAQAYCYALRDLGHLSILCRRIGHRRNASNLFNFPKLSNFFAQKVHGGITVEKQEQNLKPTTPRAERVAAGPSTRKLFDLCGRLMRENRGLRAEWRLKRARERTLRAMEARIGIYEGHPPPTVSDAEEDAIRRRVQAAEMRNRAKFAAMCGVRR
jgi:hypothetical protein